MQFANAVRVISFLTRRRLHVYAQFFFARVYLHARRCSVRRARTRAGGFARTNTRGETSETERRMRACGARHCKRMLIIFTSCNSVTLNHRQATLRLARFSALLSFSFSRAIPRAIAITTDAATCDSRQRI